MEQVLATLPYLACPLGMGLMMWLMLRGGNAAATPTTATTSVTAPQTRNTVRAPAGDTCTTNRFGLCLNWKVVGGLAAVGAVIWVAAPGVLTVAGPILLALACPLSMAFMMRGMRGTHGIQETHAVQRENGETSVVAPHGAGGAPGALAPVTATTGDEEAAELRAELALIQDRQAAVVHKLAALERQTDGAAGREAEAVATAAERRPAAR